MWIHVTCPKGHALKVSATHRGRHVKCPRCNSAVPVAAPRTPERQRAIRLSIVGAAVTVAASLAALAMITVRRPAATEDAVREQPAVTRPLARDGRGAALAAVVPSAAPAAVTPVVPHESAGRAAGEKPQDPTNEPAADAAAPAAHAPGYLRRTWYQTALMQLQRGDAGGALDSAGKIAESLARESGDERLSDAVADVRSRSGGAANADFDSLMDLIREVIEPESWDDVGGPGSMEPFPLGVYVDAEGVLRRQLVEGGKESSRLERLQRELAESAGSALRSVVYKPEKAAGSAEEFKDLRMVSLVRLEQAARHFYEAGLPLPDEVRYLGGIQRIRYVFALPESHDIVLAGYPLGTLAPAEAGDELEALRTQSRRDTAGTPVLQLDDFVVLLRSCLAGSGQTFGCTIEPRPEALAQVKEFSARPRESASRRRWVEQIREKLGRQDIRIWGVPADSRVGMIMVAADYRMKLVGIGLEDGARGIPSYLELLESHANGAPPPLETLRWWFTPRYEAIVASPEHLAFELRGEAVQVLSENQFLLANGQRQRSGAAEPINELFARNFTQFYGELADTEPLFAELRNVFDLAVVAALVTKEGLAREVGWDMGFFADGGGYAVETVDVPQSVESVVNYRVINGRHVVVAVSGGVTIDPHRATSPEQQQDAALTGIADRTAAFTAPDHWWWRPGGAVRE